MAAVGMRQQGAVCVTLAVGTEPGRAGQGRKPTAEVAECVAGRWVF